jgi:hypothetical protein
MARPGIHLRQSRSRAKIVATLGPASADRATLRPTWAGSMASSQLSKINGRYYLFNISSPGSRWAPTVIIHRADAIDGPYERRIALDDQGVAQGGLIDTPPRQMVCVSFLLSAVRRIDKLREAGAGHARARSWPGSPCRSVASLTAVRAARCTAVHHGCRRRLGHAKRLPAGPSA